MTVQEGPDFGHNLSESPVSRGSTTARNSRTSEEGTAALQQRISTISPPHRGLPTRSYSPAALSSSSCTGRGIYFLSHASVRWAMLRRGSALWERRRKSFVPADRWAALPVKVSVGGVRKGCTAAKWLRGRAGRADTDELAWWGPMDVPQVGQVWFGPRRLPSDGGASRTLRQIGATTTQPSSRS